MLIAPRRNPISGERTMNSSSGPHPLPTMMAPKPRLRHRGPGDAADQRVGGAGGQRQEPGEDVPEDRADAARRARRRGRRSTPVGDGSDDVEISPLAMVAATPVPKTKAATKLKNAAQSTACVGVSTRVLTTVAMELAAS